MTLAPRYRLCPGDGREVKLRKNRHGERAVTRFRRLASASACSLLELQPVTGEWGCSGPAATLCALSSSSARGNLALDTAGMVFGTLLLGRCFAAELFASDFSTALSSTEGGGC